MIILYKKQTLTTLFFGLAILLGSFYPLSAAELDPPFKLPSKQELAVIRSAIISTNKGDIYVRLYPDIAPGHVANFKYLADQSFYDNLPFHIYEPDYVIQTGAPNRKPNSGPGYTLPPEFNSHKHTMGTLSMVRRPNELDITNSRRSHGSQFRFILKDSPHLDGQYTAFGQVMRGIAVVKQLKKGDRISKIRVFVKN